MFKLYYWLHHWLHQKWKPELHTHACSRCDPEGAFKWCGRYSCQECCPCWGDMGHCCRHEPEDCVHPYWDEGGMW